MENDLNRTDWHITEKRDEKSAEFDPMTSSSWGVISAAVLRPTYAIALKAIGYSLGTNFVFRDPPDDDPDLVGVEVGPLVRDHVQ